MKKHLKYLKYLIIAFALIILASIIEKNALTPENFQVDTEEFREILTKKEARIGKIMDSAFHLAKPFIGKKESNLFESLGNMDFKEYSEQGFILLVYLEDSLRFWSDNSIELSTNLQNSKINNTLVKLNNAWYYIKNLHEKNLDVFGLILLKYDYSYENEYLENAFHPDFKLPESIQVSMVSLSYSYDIYDTNNAYLFSLVPTNTIHLKNDSWKYISLIYFIGIAFLFLFLDKWFRFTTLQHQKPEWKMMLMLVFLLFTRYLMLEFKYPIQIYSLSFFEPGYFAVSYLFPSLGDFFINSLVILFFTRSIFYIFRTGKSIRIIKKKGVFIKYLFGSLSIVFLILYFNFIIELLESLVINSSIPLEAHKVLELDLFSLLAYTIFGILLSTLVMLSWRILYFARHILGLKTFIIILTLILFIYGIIAYAFKMDLSIASLVYFLALISLIIYIHTRNQKYHYSFFIILIIIGSIYITLFINKTIKQKDVDKSNVLITRIINERDRVAEHLLISVFEGLKSDDSLKTYVEQYGNTQLGKIHNFLLKKYFGGYFAKYELDLVVCSDHEPYENAKKLSNCAKYYGNIIDEYGSQIENTDFYYIDKHTGRVSYQGTIEFSNDEGKDKFALYIILDSKLITQEIGYPDLLIEGKLDKNNPMSAYSYAKYEKGQLITRSGNFPYDLNDKMFRTGTNGYSGLTTKDYEHTIYQEDNSRIILTKARVKSFDLVIAFSYIFVFFNILLIITLAINNLNSIWNQLLLNFENKLLVAMLFVLALSFAMVTAGTVYYNRSQFEIKHNTNISEKIESVQKNLELEEQKGLFSDTIKTVLPSALMSEVLKGLSNIYYTDINLYDYSGNLVASSRPEIFSRGLIGSTMDPEAFKQMRINEKIRYIQNENIGKLEYSSAYALFKTGVKEKPFYINLPYFTKPAELRKETSNLIVAIINLYVVLFIVVALVSFLMANKITQPLRMLQSKFQHIELGRQSEQIIYNRRDEIGALVKEYNRMVIKLAESIELLAKNERESAWREMAKQIAHEIKNPLTPMKLSVQFLQRSWQDKDSTFEKKLEKCTQTLIDQINTLSTIASEFSTFAKMPKPKREIVDLTVTIDNIVTLFSNTENLKINYNSEHLEKLLIISDHEHISRALTNLVKNGIQAIPDDKEGIIKILVEQINHNVQIRISDNGTGIREDQKDKLFIPNFTTKSSGMGMGLPIVKDIIEAANGKIWFETEWNVGTTFIVELPLAENEAITELLSLTNGK